MVLFVRLNKLIVFLLSGLLRLYEEVLLHMDFIHLAQYLTKLPDSINGDSLFRAIECISMTTEKRSFVQVLATNRELRELTAATTTANGNGGPSVNGS